MFNHFTGPIDLRWVVAFWMLPSCSASGTWRVVSPSEWLRGPGREVVHSCALAWSKVPKAFKTLPKSSKNHHPLCFMKAKRWLLTAERPLILDGSILQDVVNWRAIWIHLTKTEWQVLECKKRKRRSLRYKKNMWSYLTTFFLKTIIQNPEYHIELVWEDDYCMYCGVAAFLADLVSLHEALRTGELIPSQKVGSGDLGGGSEREGRKPWKQRKGIGKVRWKKHYMY